MEYGSTTQVLATTCQMACQNTSTSSGDCQLCGSYSSSNIWLPCRLGAALQEKLPVDVKNKAHVRFLGDRSQSGAGSDQIADPIKAVHVEKPAQKASAGAQSCIHIVSWLSEPGVSDAAHDSLGVALQLFTGNPGPQQKGQARKGGHASVWGGEGGGGGDQHDFAPKDFAHLGIVHCAADFMVI